MSRKAATDEPTETMTGGSETRKSENADLSATELYGVQVPEIEPELARSPGASAPG